jgi:hypothetical protein
MNSYYGSVNGPACHYARLVRYNKCSLAEVAATPQTSDTDFTFKGPIAGSSAASAQAAVTAGMVRPPPTVAAAPTGAAGESFRYREGFEATGSVADYTPTYKVPNYPAIDTNALTHGVVGNCGGYFNILDAYGQNAGNCTTNFVNN